MQNIFQNRNLWVPKATPVRGIIARNYKKGFTLAELLIVTVVIVAIIGIGITIFRRFEPDIELSGAARTLVSNLRYAQQLTVTEQTNHCLKFLVQEKKYQVVRCSSGQVVSQVFLSDKITSFDVTGFTNNTVEFNPYGAVKENGQVTLGNVNNKQKIIEVRPSGFVRITD